jgi:hypothetical protein|nr:MAG TPA: Protein of unknown function (DUF551) [Caudoviricetes sp.]
MESGINGWMSIKEMMPDPEERVLLCTVSTVRGKKYEHITIGIYEDGKINEYDSKYCWDDNGTDWYDNEDVAEDGEKGGYIVPKGWWEVGVYSEVISGIDDEVIAWMPLPEVYEEINFVYDQSKSFVFPPFAQCCCCGNTEEEDEVKQNENNIR